MDNREIGINTVILKGDIDKLKSTLEQVRKSIDEAYTATHELDKMWDGPANMTFQIEFNNDQTVLVKMCDEIEKMIDSMGMAKVEYEKCEKDVNAIIDSIKI